MKRIFSILCSIIIILTLCSCKKTSANLDTSSGFLSADSTVSSDSSVTELNSSDTSSQESSKTSSVTSSVSSKTSSVTSSVSSNKNSGISSSSNSSKSESQNSSECDHYYRPATCENPGVCKFCGKVIEPALGHKFASAVCTRDGCTAKSSNWIDWYTEGAITITESEVQKIVSMQYKKPKNVIVMIGDGMGANDIELTEQNKEGCFNFGLVLNKIKYTGFATTRSHNSSVTDSAASGTALATGVKTNNGYIGVSPTREELTNVSEIARQNGKKVGIVTNDSIVGATPAAFTVHNISRENYSELAASFVKFKPDVLMGQGYSNFSSLDLSSFIVSRDFTGINYALNADHKCQKPFIGFFSENILSQKSNTLAYCTEVALNRLKNNNKGFFLMVENAATDKAGHNNDINGKVNGVVTFDRAVATVLKFMKNNPDTLLVITSDHETGGVKLPQGGFFLGESLFTTTGHTSTNVRTFALGYGAEYFHNKTVDNTDIAKFVIEAVKN